MSITASFFAQVRLQHLQVLSLLLTNKMVDLQFTEHGQKNFRENLVVSQQKIPMCSEYQQSTVGLGLG